MADQMLRIAGRGDDGLAKAIKTDNEGNVSVNIMGNKVEPLLTRQFIKGTTEFSKQVPLNAKGCVIQTSIYSVVGSGVNPRVTSVRMAGDTMPSGNTRLEVVEVMKNSLVSFYWYPGATLGEAYAITGNHVRAAGIPLGSYLVFTILVADISAGDIGADVAVNVRWLT